MHTLDLLLTLIGEALYRRQQIVTEHRAGRQFPDIYLNIPKLAEWLNKNKVVKELLEDDCLDYMHNVQYAEKVQRVIKFMVNSNTLKRDSLTAMWHAQVGKHDAIVTNVHTLLAGLAEHFTPAHLDHLLMCFKETWGGTVQNMQKSLQLIGTLAKGEQEGHVASQVLTLTWDLAHNTDTPTSIVDAALLSHLSILGGVQRADMCDDVLTMCRLVKETNLKYINKIIQHRNWKKIKTH